MWAQPVDVKGSVYGTAYDHWLMIFKTVICFPSSNLSNLELYCLFIVDSGAWKEKSCKKTISEEKRKSEVTHTIK